jgi:glycosyltransferase involved in cell wall biosynthesis
VLFIGSFVHPPNVDAAIRLAESIFPAVRARVPSARLELVGDQPPAAVRRLAGAAVDVTGYVPDTRPHVDAAAVVAAPLRLGGGMRLKVLEALAAGKAVVATPRAVAGLDLEPGTHAVVADGDAELGDALVELLEDPARRRRIGSAARDFARERLDWRHTVAAYERLYDSLERDR